MRFLLRVKINENQLALEAAIMELYNWAEQCGAAEAADNVRGTLAAIAQCLAPNVRQ
jgi:hypothetical protein